MRKLPKLLVGKRFIILAVLAISFYMAITMFEISLWYILLIGSVLGVVFGKVFCRWACPMGLIMEILMSFNSGGKSNSYISTIKLAAPSHGYPDGSINTRCFASK